MAQKRTKITGSLRRLLNLFREIQDENIREIISDVVFIESKHRSSSGKNFPMREVRDVIDRVARLQEGFEKGRSK